MRGKNTGEIAGIDHRRDKTPGKNRPGNEWPRMQGRHTKAVWAFMPIHGWRSTSKRLVRVRDER
jgi:hypothetical protein